MSWIKEGDTVGNFLVLSQVREGALGRHRRFLVCCSLCGRELEKNTNDIRRQTSCGCHYYHETREDALVSIMYSHLKKRHKPYEGDLIPLETFRHLSTSGCYYCGQEPSNIAVDEYTTETWRYTGLDRINSALGYVQGNVRPCCKRCNVAKSDMSEDDFFDLIMRIHEKQGFNRFNWES